jgi:hypothetical protein
VNIVLLDGLELYCLPLCELNTGLMFPVSNQSECHGLHQNEINNDTNRLDTLMYHRQIFNDDYKSTGKLSQKSDRTPCCSLLVYPCDLRLSPVHVEAAELRPLPDTGTVGVTTGVDERCAFIPCRHHNRTESLKTIPCRNWADCRCSYLTCHIPDHSYYLLGTELMACNGPSAYAVLIAAC